MDKDHDENMKRIDRIDRIAWTAAVVLACIGGMLASAVAAWLLSLPM